jgi:DNA-binding HxlR family transcriptional regulator
MNTTPNQSSDQHEQAWQQVVGIVGQPFVDRLNDNNRDQFHSLILNASALGRSARGPIREIQTLIGDRWTALLLQLLNYGPMRFSVLQKIISTIDDGGISRRMLSFSLRALERDGLVSRKVIASVPPNVEYSLTELGRGLRTHLSQLVEWLREHAEEVETARAKFESNDD